MSESEQAVIAFACPSCEFPFATIRRQDEASGERRFLVCDGKRFLVYDLICLRCETVIRPEPVPQGVHAGVHEGVAQEAERKGRPLAKDMHLTLAATKPWLKEGMSERTWYRRRREK